MKKEKVDYKKLSDAYAQIIDKKNQIIENYKRIEDLLNAEHEWLTKLILVNDLESRIYRKKIANLKIDKLTLIAVSIIILIGLIIK